MNEQIELAIELAYQTVSFAAKNAISYIAFDSKQLEILHNEVLRLQNENANLLDRLNELMPFVQQFGRAKRKRPEVINFYSNPAPITPFPQIFGISELMRDPSWLDCKWVLPTGAGASLSKEALANAHLSGQISLADYHAGLEAALIVEEQEELQKEIDALQPVKPKPAETVGNAPPRFGTCNKAGEWAIYDYKQSKAVPFTGLDSNEAETLAAILNSFVTKE